MSVNIFAKGGAVRRPLLAAAGSLAVTLGDPSPVVDYEFTVVGHAYSFIPAEGTTDTEALDTGLKKILNGHPFVIFTGDVVRFAGFDWPKFDAVTAGITEWYLTAGNHDRAIGTPAEQALIGNRAPRFQTFFKGEDQFILVDNVDDWNFDAQQVTQLAAAFALPARNRFVFTHNGLPYESADFAGTWLPNSFDGFTENTNQLAPFTTDVKPILESQPNVTVFMGNYGNRADGYWDETVGGVRYIGAGLSSRDAAKDSAYNTIKIYENGNISIGRVPLLCTIPDAEKAHPLVCER